VFLVPEFGVAHGAPVEVVTDRAPALRVVIDELTPTVFHNTEQHANNQIEADHGRLKARLRPMRGLKRDHTAPLIIRGHALMQNIRRGRDELGIERRDGTSQPRSTNLPEPSERTSTTAGSRASRSSQRNRPRSALARRGARDRQIRAHATTVPFGVRYFAVRRRP